MFQGQYVTQSGNPALIPSGNTTTVQSIVNSTAFTLSTPIESNTSVAMYFGNPGTAYTAIGLEPNAVCANLVNQIVLNETNYYNQKANTFNLNVTWVARYPGGIGNSLRVSQCDTAAQYSSNINLVSSNATAVVTGALAVNTGFSSATITFTANTGSLVTANVTANYVLAEFAENDQLLLGNSSISMQYCQIASVTNISNGSVCALQINFVDPFRLHTNYTSNTVQRYWEFFNVVGVAPGQSQFQQYSGNSAAQDELHVVVVDEGGEFSGTPGTVLEVYAGVSRATNAVNLNNTDNYYADVINQNSSYVWWADDRPGAFSATALNLTSATTLAPGQYYFDLGADGYSEDDCPLSVVADAYMEFASTEDIEIGLLMQGKAIGGTTVVNGQTIQNFQLCNWLLENIAEIRKDCVVFASPDSGVVLNNYGSMAQSIANWRGACDDSSYGMMDSGYKQIYDIYNNVYRWVPLNGDIAGLAAQCDRTNAAWWSFAGFNRGNIKNCVKLAYNPGQTDRDILYPAGVNPVVSFPGMGTVLYGDKTMQSKPSAFDRINVRRLFIVLEKAISSAAKYSLFEFNDAFTRAQFCNMVNPYLKSVQGGRGITDFLVVCDGTNNTPEIIDSNQFIGDMYIKPARSINFVTLNFIAVATGVAFSEVVGNWGEAV
jgi:hypothetical protein